MIKDIAILKNKTKSKNYSNYKLKMKKKKEPRPKYIEREEFEIFLRVREWEPIELQGQAKPSFLKFADGK